MSPLDLEIGERRNSAVNSLDAVTMGESMMAFEALDYGPLREVSLFKKWVGGAEDNFAIALARLGFKCGWFSRLGNDEFGREIYRTIRGEAIDVSRVIFDSHAQTGVFFVERRGNGEFECYFYRRLSATSRISSSDIDPDYIKQAKIVYLTGITPVISESARSASEKVLQLALRNKQTIVFDPNLRLKMCDIATSRSILIPMMQESSYVLPGEQELKLLMDCKEMPAAIEKAHSLGIDKLVVKVGARGAILALRGQETREIPGFAVDPVSSIGAGDAFAAGFAAGLLKEQELSECVRWGNALGAFCLMASGPYQALPDFEKLQVFLGGGTGIAR
jgi:2-dehydro-3-deoxygluconokinase